MNILIFTKPFLLRTVRDMQKEFLDVGGSIRVVFEMVERVLYMVMYVCYAILSNLASPNLGVPLKKIE